MDEGYFITLLLTYENTEKTIKGLKEEDFGWVIRINGVPQSLYTAFASTEFVVSKNQLSLTCFEEPSLSFSTHDQFNPPMTLVTKYLGLITQQGYVNTSSSMTAEKNEITFCLWNFQKKL